MPQQESYWEELPKEEKAIWESLPKEKKPTDWKKELVGGLLYKAAKRGYDITTGKYYEPMTTKKYWKQTAETLARQAGQFLTATTGLPMKDTREQEEVKLAAMRESMGEKPSPVRVAGMIGKEYGKMGVEFATFLPRTATNVAINPVETIRDEPLAVILLGGIATKGIASKWRAKTKAGQPITKQNMSEVIDKIPETVMTKEQKAGAKAKLPEQMELPLEKLEPPVAGGLAYGMEIPKTIGGVRLDKLNAPYDVKLELANLAGGMMKELKQKKVSWKETEALANELGMTVESLQKSRKGKAFNAAELEASRKIMGAATEDVFNRKNIYQENPSDANLIASTAAMQRAGMVANIVRGKKSEAGRALNILKKTYEPGELKYDFFERILKELGGREKNVEIVKKFNALDLENPVAVNKFLRDISNPKLSDKIFEVWVNAILSGPPSQVRNIVSNTFMVFDKIATTAVAAGLEAPKRLVGKKPNVYFGEVPANIFGIWNGFKEGVRKFAFAWKNEMTMEGISKLEMRHPAAIKGKAGKAVRIPGRGLVSFDEFFKSILNTMDIRAQSYKRAVSEGLKGKTRLQRISELIADPEPDMIKHATGERIARTFQAELGKAGKAIQRVREEIPGLRYIIPFTRVPINIPKQTFYRTPLNFARIALLSSRGKLKGSALGEQVAMAGMGTATAIGLFMLAKEGFVTGSPPTDKNERDAFYREGKQPRSIKIGNKWVSYEPVEPLGTLLAVSADAAEIWDRAAEGERDKIASMLVQSTIQNVSDKTFMRGLSLALNAISDPMRGGEHFIESFAGTVVPTGVAYAARAKDPYLRDAQGLIASIKSRIPGMAETLPLRVDAWGRPIKREGPALERFISPFYYSTEETNLVDKELERLKLFIGQPSRRVGKKKLSPEDYSVMSQQIGGTLFRVLNGLVKQPFYQQASEEEKKKKIRSVAQQVRKMGRIPYYRPIK